MLALMNKELKRARARIEELELREGFVPTHPVNNDSSVKELKERAEGAEKAMAVLKMNFEDLAAENTLLRTALEDMEDRKSKIKKEDCDKTEKVMKNKSVGTDAVEEKTEYVINLENTLEKYYAKYKQAKQAKKELGGEYTELQRKVDDLDNLLQEVQHNTLSSLAQLPKQPTASKVWKFLEKLPPCLDKPRGQDISPILDADIDLKEYLSSDPRTKEYTAHTLFLPGLIAMVRPGVHALAAGPLFTLNDEERWVKISKFNHLYDKTFHLFHEKRQLIFYEGMYKAIKLLDEYPEGLEALPYISRKTLALSTIPETQARNLQRLATLDVLYRDGLLKIEYLGLQCVGFDQQLYTRLKDRYEVSKLAMPTSKRKIDHLYPEIERGESIHSASPKPTAKKKKFV
ncbi:hypothetical protein D9613_004706 [Agrocybe pediades]|uniref:Uncharacterized protein n=1 Tax=Agrocybe pediades TaxID=84607 RepID=A0A8H4QZR1_9AGAR|nr:hypothetical protein D9613_004706 [Agrocybe pediades]